jgi:hypothetical protein
VIGQSRIQALPLKCGSQGQFSESGAMVENFCLFREFGLQSATLTAEKQMSSKMPKPRFKHRTVQGMPQRVESYCMRCEQFVGASDKPQPLKIAEKAHACVKIENLKK